MTARCAMVHWHPYRSGPSGIPQCSDVYLCERCRDRLAEDLPDGVAVLVAVEE